MQSKTEHNRTAPYPCRNVITIPETVYWNTFKIRLHNFLSLQQIIWDN